MASIYAELIRESRPTRGIILGGWSLGGSLAVEIARILHVDGTVPIAGVVLIDTPCPNPAVKALLPKLRFDEHCPPETRLLVEMSVRESLRMAGSYDPPLFEGDWRRPETEPAEMAQPPPFVLLRATEYMPIEISPDPKRGMDCTRELPLLGWEHTGLGAGSWGTRVGEGQRVELVKAVLEVQGHHCNLFEDHPEELTMQMNKACEMLERNYKRNESSGGDSEWERLVPPEYRTTNYQRKFKAKL
ncbi:MAG: hypothetical protein M4579_001735 [Chaenotheca gracillima]|nr:MAG: hypothetical protein M4579_001735 [Chaenotheca gracillima]